MNWFFHLVRYSIFHSSIPGMHWPNLEPCGTRPLSSPANHSWVVVEALQPSCWKHVNTVWSHPKSCFSVNSLANQTLMAQRCVLHIFVNPKHVVLGRKKYFLGGFRVFFHLLYIHFLRKSHTKVCKKAIKWHSIMSIWKKKKRFLWLKTLPPPFLWRMSLSEKASSGYF